MKIIAAASLCVVLLPFCWTSSTPKFREDKQGSYCTAKCPSEAIEYVHNTAICCADCRRCGLQVIRGIFSDSWTFRCANPDYIKGNCEKCEKCDKCARTTSINGVKLCGPGCVYGGMIKTPNNCTIPSLLNHGKKSITVDLNMVILLFVLLVLLYDLNSCAK